MDRMIVYPGAIPLDTDLLNVQRATMKALGFLAQACLGNGPVADGLACMPTVPASMTVDVGPGSLTVLGTVDTLPYGSLPADTANLVKMGVAENATSFTLTAPSVSGQSVNYLIEASLLETDTVPTVLPYYNAANPAQGFAGPGNDGSAQNTQRTQTVALRLVAGAAANTGTQTTPASSPGAVPIAVVTVGFAQTTIDATSIAVPQTGSFVPWKLPQLDFRASATRAGWQRLPSGIVLQWGTAASVTGKADPVAFPLTFPNNVISVVACEGDASGWSGSGPTPTPTVHGVSALSASGFSISCAILGTGGAAWGPKLGFNWLAVGY